MHFNDCDPGHNGNEFRWLDEMFSSACHSRDPDHYDDDLCYYMWLVSVSLHSNHVTSQGYHTTTKFMLILRRCFWCFKILQLCLACLGVPVKQEFVIRVLGCHYLSREKASINFQENSSFIFTWTIHLFPKGCLNRCLLIQRRKWIVGILLYTNNRSGNYHCY